MALTLVVMAAGLGTRFGAPKQLSPLGPSGETLLDYAIYDATCAGFTRAVLVIREELGARVRDHVARVIGGAVPVQVVEQRLDDLPGGCGVPEGRVKPWGTAHAVLAVRDAVEGPFAACNADDFYGRDALRRAAEFLAGGQTGDSLGTFASIAYHLRDTLSAAGGVNRGVCHADGDGWLESVEEVVDIRRLEDGAYAGTDPRGRPVQLAADDLVSMNLWAFTPAVFAVLRRGFAEFLRQASAGGLEFLISHGIGDAVRRGEARVRLLSTQGRWLGVTYPDDRPRVEAALRQLVAAGEYPERLWP